MAAKGLAKAAVRAAHPVVIRLRENCARRGKRVIAQLARAFLEQDSRLIHEQRRKRIVAIARGFEHVAAVDLAALQISRLARHAQIVFGLIVERFEIGVRQRPIGHRGILRDGRCAVALDRVRVRAEIVLMHAPRKRAVMDGPAAGLIAVIQNVHGVRARACVGTPRHRLALPVRAKILPLEVTQFIVRVEIRGAESRAALQANDLHSRLAQLSREDSSDRAHTNDHDICFLGCHCLSPPRRAFGYGLQADHGRARERLLALQIRRREDRLRAGKCHQPPAGEIPVAAV